jgi:hypothetical protein
MSAKYQVFVSSTFNDLKDERDLIIKATMEMGHIPVGMEMFSAADEEQWNIIKKQIDQTDYYIVIIAHRYGSCDALGISYTEKEYDYAVSLGIPALGFIIEDTISWPREKSEVDSVAIEKLNVFKEKVKSKHVSFWKNRDDLYGKCSIALMKAFNAYPREGWVRASLVQDVSSSKEVIRLSSENATLRERLAKYEQASSKEMEIEKVLTTLRANKRQISVWKKDGDDWEEGGILTLYQIFEAVAPELQVESELESIAKFFALSLCNVPQSEQRKTWPIPRNQVRSILADFAALNCIIPSQRKKPASDTNEYWCLGQFGVELLAHMRRRRLEKIERLAKIESGDKPENI